MITAVNHMVNIHNDNLIFLRWPKNNMTYKNLEHFKIFDNEQQQRLSDFSFDKSLLISTYVKYTGFGR